MHLFAVPRPSEELIELLQLHRRDLISFAAEHIRATHNLQSSLATVKLGVEHVFNAPKVPTITPSVAKTIEPFTQYGIINHRDKPFCVPCNHSFTAATAQNVVDHLTSDVQDDRLASSVHTKTYHLAPGYTERQKERDQIKAKRAARKDGGEKRPPPEIKEDHVASRKKRRADFSSLPVPELLPGPLSAVLEQEETKRAYYLKFCSRCCRVACQCMPRSICSPTSANK